MVSRGSHAEMFYEETIPKSFAKFTEQNLSAIVAIWRLEACNVMKKRLQHSYFSANFA